MKIGEGIDTLPLLFSLQRQPALWNQKRSRTTFEGTPHGAVDDIWLRFSDDGKTADTQKIVADGDCIWHPAIHALPQARIILLDVMRRLEAYALDRVVITRLAPGKTILPHTDNEGSYVNDPDRQRHHVVVQGLPGSLYRTGNETVCMRTGEVWWFDARTEHEVVNNSADDRIHMLVDLRVMP